MPANPKTTSTDSLLQESRTFPPPADAVKVVLSKTVCGALWMVPAAPPSLCRSTTDGTVPHKFFIP